MMKGVFISTLLTTCNTLVGYRLDPTCVLLHNTFILLLHFTFLMLWHICITPLPDTINSVALRHGPCLMGSHGVTCHPHILHLQGQSRTWNIYIRNFHQQSPTVYKLLHISPIERMAACVIKLECRVRVLNPGQWRQRRVCYYSVTCYLKVIHIHLMDP